MPRYQRYSAGVQEGTVPSQKCTVVEPDGVRTEGELLEEHHYSSRLKLSGIYE